MRTLVAVAFYNRINVLRFCRSTDFQALFFLKKKVGRASGTKVLSVKHVYYKMYKGVRIRTTHIDARVEVLRVRIFCVRTQLMRTNFREEQKNMVKVHARFPSFLFIMYRKLSELRFYLIYLREIKLKFEIFIQGLVKTILKAFFCNILSQKSSRVIGSKSRDRVSLLLSSMFTSRTYFFSLQKS